MKKYFALTVMVGVLASSGAANSDQCADPWKSYDVATGPIGPKDYYGDTNAAYINMLWNLDATTVLRIRGEFPQARYFSFQTSKQLGAPIGLVDYQTIQDFQMSADSGENPFIPPVINNGTSTYTLDIVPAGASFETPYNRLDSPTDAATNLAIRIYDPYVGQVTYGEFPTVEALDLNGQSKKCPQFLSLTVTDPLTPDPATDPAYSFVISALKLAFAGGLAQQPGVFRFKTVQIPFASNAAVPGYQFAMSKMKKGNVALVKFKAPTFTYPPNSNNSLDLSKDTRYWSMCVLRFFKGKGLACLPDYLAKTDSQGFVTLVFGPHGAVEEHAKALGYSFLPDLRPWYETDLTLVYRNLLPSDSFRNTGFQKGDYVPKARICTSSAFLVSPLRPGLSFCSL